MNENKYDTDTKHMIDTVKSLLATMNSKTNEGKIKKLITVNPAEFHINVLKSFMGEVLDHLITQSRCQDTAREYLKKEIELVLVKIFWPDRKEERVH